jgi:hypothetical protein
MGLKMFSAQNDILLECGNCGSPNPYRVELENGSKIIGVKSGINFEQPGLHYDT